MVEISWGNAFGYGLRYIAYIILWAIVGGLIAVGGGLMIFGSSGIGYNDITKQWESTGINLGGVFGGIAVIVIGEVVVIIGAIASYFKLMSKLITEAMRTEQTRLPPP